MKIKSSKIKISVVIPVYNVAKYLPKCLDSILNQTLKEIEIICINDGSSDKSLEILKKYKKLDERIIIVNQKNNGASSARNNGLNLLKGEYFISLDSDDWIKKDYLEKVYEKAKKNDLDMVISDIIFKYEDEEKIIKDLEIDEIKLITGREYINCFFNINNKGYNWNKLIKSKIIKENKIYYNEKIFKQEDVDFILRASYFMNKIGKINQAFYYYRQGDNNGSRKVTLKNLIDRKKSYDSLIEFFYMKKEKEIVEMVIREKEIVIFSDIVQNNYYKLENSSENIKLILDEIKKNKKKYWKKRKIEKLKILCLINLFKILSEDYSYLLVKILSYLYRVIKRC